MPSIPKAIRPIAVYHEHQEWFRPLFAELDRRGTPYVRIDARRHHYDVAAREREFGVRVALGSTRNGIAGLVIRQGATWMAVGLAAGVVGVVFVGTMLRNLLYGVKPFDPLTLAVTALLIVACASIALLAPVRRATQVDPISVMR